MASFYYNKSSGESAESQWAKYLQNQSFVNDIRGSVQQQTSDFNRFFNSSSKEQKQAIHEATSNICGSLERGFAQLGGRLEDINSSIADLHYMLDWKMDLMIEGLKISNIYLGNIIQLLRIPDIQKQRAYFVEQGLIYLKNAIDEGGNSTFFKEALIEFDKALAIENKDFFTLHRLGLIYYSSTDYLNLRKAANYFMEAAKYAKATANARPASMLAVGNNNGEAAFRDIFTRESLFEEAANSLIYASRCCYLLNKYEEGYLMAEEAFKLAPKSAEAGFQLLKMAVAVDQPVIAAKTLEKVIEIDRNYSVKVLTDPELIENNKIRQKVNEISTNAIRKATQKYNDCIKNKIPKSVAEIELTTIKKKLDSNGFLGAMDALDLFKKRDTYFIRYNTIGWHDDEWKYVSEGNVKRNETIEAIIKEEVETNKHNQEIEREVNTFNENKRVRRAVYWIIAFLGIVSLIAMCSKGC